MARPPNVIPSVSLHLRLPQDLVFKLSLQLHSPSEGKIPQGSLQRFFIELLTKHFKDQPPCP